LSEKSDQGKMLMIKKNTGSNNRCFSYPGLHENSWRAIHSSSAGIQGNVGMIGEVIPENTDGDENKLTANYSAGGDFLVR
jgi:hypothetical protein